MEDQRICCFCNYYFPPEGSHIESSFVFPGQKYDGRHTTHEIVITSGYGSDYDGCLFTLSESLQGHVLQTVTPSSYVCDMCIHKYLCSGDLIEYYHTWDYYEHSNNLRIHGNRNIRETELDEEELIVRKIVDEQRQIKRGEPYDSAISSTILHIYIHYKNDFEVYFNYGGIWYRYDDEYPDNGAKIMATKDDSIGSFDDNVNDGDVKKIVEFFRNFPFVKIYKSMKRRMDKYIKEEKEKNNEEKQQRPICCISCDYFFDTSMGGGSECKEGHQCATYIERSNTGNDRLWLQSGYGSCFDQNKYSISEALQYWMRNKLDANKYNGYIYLVCDRCVTIHARTGEITCTWDDNYGFIKDNPSKFLQKRVKGLILQEVGKKITNTLFPAFKSDPEITETLTSLICEAWYITNVTSRMSYYLRFKYLDGLFVAHTDYIDNNPEVKFVIELVAERNNPRFTTTLQPPSFRSYDMDERIAAYSEKYPKIRTIYELFHNVGPLVTQFYKETKEQIY